MTLSNPERLALAHEVTTETYRDETKIALLLDSRAVVELPLIDSPRAGPLHGGDWQRTKVLESASW